MAIWKSIVGFSNYEISNDGKIRRATEGKTCAGKIIPAGYELSLKAKKKGHLECRLVSNEGKSKFVLVHRLVAFAFLGDCPKRGYIVCHINGNPADNRVENLKWASNSENQLDRKAHGTSTDGHRHPFAKLNIDQVKLIIKMWESGMTQSAIARHFQVVPTTICRIVSGKSYVDAQGEQTCPA